MQLQISPLKLTIKQWNEDDKPREKLITKGKSTLSNSELIAIIIGMGSSDMTAVELAKYILDECGNNLSELGKKSVHDLMKFRGIGEAKAVSILAALELGRRRKFSEELKKTKIGSSREVYEYMHDVLSDIQHEEFWVIFLNRANKIIRKERISVGGINGTVADARIIFKTAVDLMSSAVILVHNHPSGSTEPSMNDKKLTRKMKESGEILDIPVLDHIIYTETGYFSFADEGIL